MASKTIVYNMDCMDYMRSLPDNAFELAIVDPPYGIGEDGRKSASRGKQADFGRRRSNNAKSYARTYKPFQGGDVAPPAIYFTELRRVSKNQIIFGANHFVSRNPINSHCWIVWDKENGDNDFADCELAWTSFKSAVRIYRYKWNGMLQGNMKNKEIRIHPTQKPVALYTWLLQRYAKEGDRILDTHLGSGSSRIAAYDLGFEFVGCELDPYYFAEQEKRFAEYTAQISIF